MPKASYIPPSHWKHKEISYQQLCDIHYTSNGILPDEDTGRVKSVQAVVPNDYGYDDFFFGEDHIVYCKSEKHHDGNDALEKSLEEHAPFRAFLRYKSKSKVSRQLLKEKNIPTSYCKKVYDLGLVYISGVNSQGQYILKPKETGVMYIQSDESE